jgi:two-component sensor histidine kinase
MYRNRADEPATLEAASLSDLDDEVDETSQILWIDEASYTRVPLSESLKRQPHVMGFLKASGAVWPDKDCECGETFVRYLWNALTRLVIIAAACLIIANFGLYIAESRNFFGFDLTSWGLDLVFIMQSIALMWSLVSIRRRLASISTALEVSYFEGSLKYCVIYFSASFFPSILYPVYHILLLSGDEVENSSVQVAVYSVLPFTEIAVAGFLSVHMLFILVDAQTLATSFACLAESVRSSSVSSKRSQMILREIHHRVRNSMYEVTPIVLTATLEIVVLVGMLRKDYIERDFVPMLLLLFLFLKEIQFLVLVLVVWVYCAGKRCQVSDKRLN